MSTSYAHFLKMHMGGGPTLTFQSVYYNRYHFYFDEFVEIDVEYQPFSGLSNTCFILQIFFVWYLNEKNCQ